MQPKSLIRDLAVLGGKPAFAETLHVGRPNIGNKERLMSRISDIIDRRWLTNAGPCVLELERKIAQFVGVKHCLTMCNATVALEIAIRAADLTGEVIVPSYTFIATAHSLQWQQITPVFCDLDPTTHNIDPAKIEQMITPRTSGIIGVHVWGRPCNTDAIEEIGRRRNLKVIYDAAHAFGCSHKGKMIGGFGLAEVYSFHATKFFNTFEGGAVVTNDDALAEKMRLMRNFGFAGFDNVVYIGTNGKMSEVCAAMGLTGLESLDEFIATNRRNYELYRSGLEGIPGLSLIRYDDRERCNYQYMVVEVDESKSVLTRDQIIDVLHAENILARKYFWPGCHNMQPYRSLFPHSHLMLPKTKEVADRVFLVPTGTSMNPSDIGAVCHILRLAIANPTEVKNSLSSRATVAK